VLDVPVERGESLGRGHALNYHSDPSFACVTLRPARLLFRQGLLGLAVGSTLIFAVLYWLGIPAGYGVEIAVLQAGLLFCTLVVVRQYLDTRIILTVDGVVERTFVGRRSRVHRQDVHSVLIMRMYEHQSAETLPHLFAADTDGKLLLRMRGQYWTANDMEVVAIHLRSRIVRQPEPVSMAEFHAESPQLLYWFERAAQLRQTAASEPRDVSEDVEPQDPPEG
jgi:hypothetical protein